MADVLADKSEGWKLAISDEGRRLALASRILGEHGDLNDGEHSGHKRSCGIGDIR